MSLSTLDRTAIIIGAGVAGPALAHFLKRAGYVPQVFEAHARTLDAGGGLQIAPNGMHVLEQIGVAERLRQNGVESAEMCFENQFGRGLGRIPNGPRQLYSSPAIQVKRATLQESLLDVVDGQGIPVEYGKRLTDVSMNGKEVLARFEDGTTAAGSILIGADGIHSRTREVVFPDAPRPQHTGLTTVGGFARHEGLAPASERELMAVHMIFGASGFFGYGYVDRADPCAVMWWSHLDSGNQPGEEESRAAEEDRIRQRVLDRHRGWAEPVELVIRSSQRVLWGPIYDLPTLLHWSRERVVLIGDAAHATSPHAGQGASLALEDALLLAKHLGHEGHERAFRLFHGERRRRVETIIAKARRRGEKKHALTPGAATMRDRMLSLYLRFRGKRMNDMAYRFEANWD